MKKRYLVLIICLCLLPHQILANSIQKISMDIYVDNNGTAHVTEEWITNLKEGTEGYKPYYNLGDSDISNFKVTLNGKEYTYQDYWNTNDTFTSKKYRNGINYISNGIELCFGISEYGQNTYVLSYDISNFVINTNDNYQIIYWTLFPYDYNPSPDRVYIKIYSDFSYSDTLDVWGYGKGGVPTYVYDGYIEMDSEGKVYPDEYLTILVKFPNNAFNTIIKSDKTFDEYLYMANEGAVKYKEEEQKKSVLAIIFSLLPFIIFFIIIFSVLMASNAPKYGTYRLKYAKGKKKLQNVNYFRDMPYRKEKLIRAYWISCQYNLVKRKTDYLGALLLKWIKLGNISIKNNDDKEKSTIVLNNCKNLPEEEIELYNMMYTASKDGILEKNEFTNWCRKNYTQILNWFNKVIDNETEKMLDEGLLTKVKGFRKCLVNDSLTTEAYKVAGLKKFLNDFSNIKDRSAIEVNLWEEYLMYALIFGIAKKVMKEFKDLYPEVITDDVYDDFNLIYAISYSGMSSATSARDHASNYSSGGGGFSSSGGGGGSFGGGGGGGGFR